MTIIWTNADILSTNKPHFNEISFETQKFSFKEIQLNMSLNWRPLHTHARTPLKGRRRGTWLFSLICTWINGWVNNHKAGDLRRHSAHYSVTVMVNRPGWLIVWNHGFQDPYSLNGRTSYRMISCNLETAGLMFKRFESLWSLRHLGSSAVKFLNDMNIITPKLMASRLHEILR